MKWSRSCASSFANDEAPDDIYQKYFDLIEHTTVEMESLLSKLTQVHEALNKHIVKEDVDIPSLLNEVRESIKFLNLNEKTTYSFDLDPNISIKTDHFLLKIILQNIMENAMIFRRGNRYEHHIHIETWVKKGIFTTKIRDTGIGIAEDQMKEVYNMFYRGSDQSKGNGLGLYLVKISADKLRGKIDIHSEVGKFTEFTVSIPV